MIYHSVALTLIAVASQFWVSVLLPVVHAQASLSVSVVIDIVIVPAETLFINVTAVPIGNATDALAGIVQIRAVVSAEGW